MITPLSRSLNPSQLSAVTVTDRPLLVLAGAGSGKTRVITYKVAYLILNKVAPQKILAITFSRKAANEMKERVAALTGVESKWISTFHSFCLKVLRQHVNLLRNGLKPDFTVYDEDDAFQLFTKICKDSSYESDESELFRKLSFFRQYGEIDRYFKGNYKEYEICKTYEKALIDCNAVDFDSMQIFALQLLLKPEIKRIYTDKFSYILVDEFQDTSPVQYNIVKSLTKNGNITVVGDPQQSIYSFRGAAVDNVLRFKEDFNPYEVKLEENYRSTKTIISVANNISNLVDYKWRSLVVKLKPTQTDEGVVKTYMFNTEYEEARWIAYTIKGLLGGFQPKQIAILVRTRYVKLAIKETLRRYNIPLDDIDDYDFFKRAEVKDVLSYLKFAANPLDFIALERAITTPPKRIGLETLQKIKALKRTDYLQALQSYTGVFKQKSQPVKDFVRLIRHLQTLLDSPAEAIKFVIRATNYKDYLKRKYSKDYENRYSSLLELHNILRQYKSFQKFLDDSLLVEDRKERNTVKLMTVHSAKGLEFDVVFLPAVEQGVFPDRRSLADFDEEVRCFYVAVTRAKKYLFLSACKLRNTFDTPKKAVPSVFFRHVADMLKTIQYNPKLQAVR